MISSYYLFKGTKMLYGVKTLEYSSARPKDIPCISCEKSGETFVRKHVSVFHFFFIPMFPFWIKSELECVHCKSEIQYSELAPESRKKYRKFVPFKFPPIWTFMGILLILGGIAWANINSWKSRQKIRERLVNLEVGRFLEYQQEKGPALRLRVTEVSDQKATAVLDPPKDILLPQDDFPDASSRDTLILNRVMLLDWFDDKKLESVHW